jgi:hypothetical protein
MWHRLFPAVSLLLLSTVSSAAELRGYMVRCNPTAPVFTDDFERPELGDAWKISRDEYSIKDGVFVTGQRPEHAHPAVCRTSVTLRDALVQFRFRLRGARGLTLVLNDRDYQGSHAGHICRVGVTPAGVTLGDDKEGPMKLGVYEKWKDMATRAEVEPLVKDRRKSVPHALEADRWYEMTVEFAGDEMLAVIDGKPIAYLKSPGIAHPTKNYWGFTTSGRYAEIDDLRVWHGSLLADEWPARRAREFPADK